jgi:hypothetical protein
MNKSIYHRHHIIPRHAGGNDEPSNIVLLTVEEHAEAHKKLWEEHGRIQDKLAWLMLSKQIEAGRSAYAELMRLAVLKSIETRRKNGYGSPSNKGVPMSENQKAILRDRMQGKRPWNAGGSCSVSAANGKKGAAKLSKTVTGRKRTYREDGSWFWSYPEK